MLGIDEFDEFLESNFNKVKEYNYHNGMVTEYENLSLDMKISIDKTREEKTISNISVYNKDKLKCFNKYILSDYDDIEIYIKKIIRSNRINKIMN